MSLTIVLDNSSGIYYNPGDTVSGRLIADLDEPLTMTAVRLMIKGEARVSLTSIQAYFLQARIEPIFLSVITLSLDPSMPAGHHEFAFSIPLTGKDQLPGTGKFFPGPSTAGPGRIDYLIQAYIDQPSSNFDIKTERNIVVRPIRLFEPYPAMASPKELHGEKNICCWCCMTGRISVKISFPKLVFANNELIAFNADITNQSGRTIKKMVATLEQETRYNVDGFLIVRLPRPLEESVSTNPIKPGDRKQWTNTEFRVPPLSDAYPTLLEPMCAMINVRYNLVFEFYISGCTINLKLQTPVIIRTIE